jgi:hypothetical protein
LYEGPRKKAIDQFDFLFLQFPSVSWAPQSTLRLLLVTNLFIFVLFVLCLFVETVSPCNPWSSLEQVAGLELAVFLLQTPECWDYRQALP